MISIIIPTLNEESILEKTLSDLKRSFTISHEVIVTDGRSKDRTIEIAQRLADKTVVYAGTTRQTIAMGRNDGAAAASGDFLAFMDADCTIPKPDEFFAKALKHFADDPRLVALTPKIKVLPESETFGDKFFFGMLNFNKLWINNVLHKGESGGELQFMPRTAYDKVHGYRGDLVTREDADMFMRLSKIGRTLYDPSMIVYHTGRRAHKIGWSKLMWDWTLNTIWVMLFDKAHAQEWKVVR
jgi:glycosyltransferase involved in cell wall biosynthesis